MTDTAEPTICSECGHSYGAHDATCSALRRYPFYAPNTDCRPPREAEYRRVWLEVAMRFFVDPSPNALPTIGHCFSAADAFLAELKKRDAHA